MGLRRGWDPEVTLRCFRRLHRGVTGGYNLDYDCNLRCLPLVGLRRAGLIEVSARDRMDGMLEVCVKDTGCGIPEENLAQIFEPFAQASDSLTREYGGTGLGLSMVKTLVTAHHGTITCTSTVGKGAPPAPPPSSPLGSGEMIRREMFRCERSFRTTRRIRIE
eukprot:4158762-Pyramimonas_sp.AAC.1